MEKRYAANEVSKGINGLIRSEIRFGSEMPQRDAIAKQAGQRCPSEKTWALVLGKLERRKVA